MVELVLFGLPMPMFFFRFKVSYRWIPLFDWDKGQCWNKEAVQWFVKP